ncbi:hypothetical protein GIB67_013423 [Kingdonia uniflora]|uniref:Uncharacterized protein n=1 Tax=Kingdonia uniflora TaxID=39325 RepID=A0A7J7LRA1_9MAGN|nr:hypothetical protein GIB67_013423 [Kingdonia uniflora]
MVHCMKIFSGKNYRSCFRVVVVVILLLVLFLELYNVTEPVKRNGVKVKPYYCPFREENRTVYRKLLASSLDEGVTKDGISNKYGEICSKNDIALYQGPTTPLPNGIPTYTVQILNVCVSGCAISNIHINCGWFSSARMINPRVFKRICYDDCLVNNGEPIGPGESLSFQYANSFQYPLYVSSVTCC